MIHRNICPICGSENPEGAEFCQVCQANLRTLPDDMFPADAAPAAAPQTEGNSGSASDNNEIDLDSPVPLWLQKRFQQKDKQEQSAFDFDSYTNALFGVGNNRETVTPSRVSKPQKQKKTESVYQPFLENLIEPPLIEPDENSPKTITENVPGIADFKIRRPARKWDDRLPEGSTHINKSSSIDLLHDFDTERPARKWDDQETEEDFTLHYDENGMLALPSWWKDDAPLVETDDMETEEKGSEIDELELVNSVSPSKVINADQALNSEGNSSDNKHSASGPYRIDEYEPESGSLLSDLMNEINSSSGSLTPAERQEKENGTVFYSGNHPADPDVPEQDPASEVIEINTSEDSSAGNAAMLDQILRGFGYQVEGEPQPEPQAEDQERQQDNIKSEAEHMDQEPARTADKQEKPAETVHEVYVPQVIENPLVIPDHDDEDDSGEKDADPEDFDSAEKIAARDDDAFDLDIPWDLFGAADMSLPQSPEDPEYRTFSRSGIPEEADSTAYQQRMISSILGKIIHAENLVEPEQEKNERYISFGARLFWSLLAVCGVVLILTTGIVDHLFPAPIKTDELSSGFYQAAAETEGTVLFVMDYTPAFSTLMDDAADKLLTTLEEHTEKIYAAVLNPAAMPSAQQILNKNKGKVEFAGWWPSGVISIRTRIAFGSLPEQIWLLTSESSSVQNWAEQLAVSNGKHKLHVMTPGQMAPIVRSYLDAGLVSSALCSDIDLQHYGAEEHSADRNMMAVWYLTALLPLAWLAGALAKFFKTKPNYEKLLSSKTEDGLQDPEKETVNG